MKYIVVFMILVVPVYSFGSTKEVSSRGWYAGAGVGIASFSMADQGDTLEEDTDTSITAFGGYRFNRFLAIQGGFADLGKYTNRDSVLNYTELSGVNFTAVGLLPVSQSGLDLFGRLGLGILRYTQNFELFGTDFDNTSTGEAITASLGVNYTHPKLKHITFHIAYDYYYFQTQKTYSTNNESESNSIGVASLGARYNF